MTSLLPSKRGEVGDDRDSPHFLPGHSQTSTSSLCRNTSSVARKGRQYHTVPKPVTSIKETGYCFRQEKGSQESVVIIIINYNYNKL